MCVLIKYLKCYILRGKSTWFPNGSCLYSVSPSPSPFWMCTTVQGTSVFESRHGNDLRDVKFVYLALLLNFIHFSNGLPMQRLYTEIIYWKHFIALLWNCSNVVELGTAKRILLNFGQMNTSIKSICWANLLLLSKSPWLTYFYTFFTPTTSPFHIWVNGRKDQMENWDMEHVEFRYPIRLWGMYIVTPLIYHSPSIFSIN